MLILQMAVGNVLDAWLSVTPVHLLRMYTLPVVWLDNVLLLAAANAHLLQRSVCCAGP